MHYGHYRFTCRFTTPAMLPAWKGSTLRGLFGHGLKRAVCALRRQNCESCLLRDTCLYTRTFETHLLQSSSEQLHGRIPHPFVIEPPLEETTRYEPGDRMSCGLILLGKINLQLPYFVYAFEQMGQIGTGRRIDAKRGQFVLEAVESEQGAVYQEGDQSIRMPEQFKDLRIEPEQIPAQTGDLVTVTLQTPLRFKQNGRLTDQLPFATLMRVVLRTVSSLGAAYDGWEPILDYKELIQRAEAVETVESRLRWTDRRRYSNRQKEAMQMGGILGSVSYKGSLGEYLPLLRFAEKTHIGKQTSFGLGKIAAQTF